jgi:voltage-gated potassium channel Kch
MRRLSFVGVCLTPVLLLLGAAGTPAAASTSVPVTIQDTVIIGPFTGTWSASGGISDSGTLTQPTDHLVDNGQIRIVRDMTGSQGTITLRIDLSLSGQESTGHWVVIAGTGAYAALHGQGTDSGIVANGVVTETLTGSVHFD